MYEVFGRFTDNQLNDKLMQKNSYILKRLWNYVSHMHQLYIVMIGWYLKTSLWYFPAHVEFVCFLVDSFVWTGKMWEGTWRELFVLFDLRFWNNVIVLVGLPTLTINLMMIFDSVATLDEWLLPTHYEKNAGYRRLVKSKLNWNTNGVRIS